MNEELTKELNLLQEKFNKEIEDVKKKYEIKEKTLNEFLLQFDLYESAKKYDLYIDLEIALKENKQEVINILNNL